ncbi:MAG: HAMP domain-containing sensor histidine kinase [Peptoniphilus harei]|uniref:sensor histidine kinase n=1 Tax=Bacillota TaxID=1239 RepID=UPI00254C296B|nr:HAMP domain-containing sensor histidine kinase [Peptoniphilus harei]MDK7755874.1 HAMP domain-containing sensor histidine kinase [Peptoniphilus harei]MDK7761707.1 HAMP domain-containing sensor histidine kinase [Peptoniphilus harei]MDK8271708.1 HAMP domain-containing sensor histidine kinase [Peptoniphilus harei]MDK8340208.1 HAMP domain-containing sensor histidine kinase [Peptoniphilus harei]
MNKKKWLKKLAIIIFVMSIIIIILKAINYTASFELGNKFISIYMKDSYVNDNIEGISGILLWGKLKSDILIFICLIIIILVLTYIITGYFIEKNTKLNIEKNCIRIMKCYINHIDLSEEDKREEFYEALTELSTKYLIVNRYSNNYLIKDEMIADFAHDIRTPLSSIIGFLTLIKNDNDMSEKSRDKYINTLLEKSYEVQSQLEDLFYISKYNFEHKNKSKKEENLKLFLDQISDELYPEYSNKGLIIDINVDDSIRIIANLEELAKALVNIITNAVKYTKEFSTIKIKAKITDGLLNIEISNKSEYISEKDLSRVFNRFYRVDQSRNPNIGGSGLGLAISKAIIENMGGTIKAEYQGGNFIIKIFLPNLISCDY